ncbi:hypothetical protein HYW61_01960 [candidate division WWE3 bacterium]|nr:hypothetical protein [candidate division WWE3 bacterium]
MGAFGPIRWKKAIYFLSIESCFVATIAYTALAMFGVDPFAPFAALVFFVTGSIELIHATWLIKI